MGDHRWHLTRAHTEMTIIGGGISLVPGTVARIFGDEVVVNPRLQIIFAKFLDRDQNNQPRWKYTCILVF